MGLQMRGAVVLLMIENMVEPYRQTDALIIL